MSSTFMGINTAMRGLYTSQAGLLVTSNNISNVDTKGYSRQIVSQSAVGPAAVYCGSGLVGGGSQVDSIIRVRSSNLDQRYWKANDSLGEWETKASSLSEIESILGEPTSNGFNTVMDEFYAALEDLASNPSETSARAALRETGNSLCEYLNTIAGQLIQLQADANKNVKTTIEEINSYAKQIADLNQRILAAANTGASTNDLEDKRAVLMDSLSKLVEVDINESVVGTNSAGAKVTTYVISVYGNTLVNGGNARQLECYEIQDGSDKNGLYGIRWQDTKDEYESSGGSLKAYLDLRDGKGTDGEYNGIPYYISQFDKYARTFAKAFNEGIYADGNSYYIGHAGGLDANGSEGVRFFSYSMLSSADLLASGEDLDAVYNNITAANISLSLDIIDDLNKIAAASAAGGAENNANVNDLISICKDSRLFNKGTPEDFINSIIAALGTESSFARRLYDNMTRITQNINDNRNSISGVSTNEETANLTKYQQAYTAAANLIAVWSKIYEETIDLID